MKTMMITLLAVLTTGVIAQQNPFLMHPVYESFRSVQSAACGDLDQNGYQDIVIAEPLCSEIIWFRNLGSGQFQRDTLGSFPGATYVAVNDLDGDSDLDVLVASESATCIGIFECTETGKYDPYKPLCTAAMPVQIALGDIDGDGDTDIASAGNGVTLLINMGNAVFSTEELNAAPVENNSIKMCDIDDDGDMDIVSNILGANGGILIYKQINNQTFQEMMISYPYTNDVDLADMNGDGLIDIIAVSCGTQVSVFLNNNSPVFQKVVIASDFECGISVLTSDFNQDHRMDIIAASWDGSVVGYWENMDNLTFIFQPMSLSVFNPYCITGSDLNNDGKEDFVVTSESGVVAWFENQSTNSLHALIQESGFSASFDAEAGMLVLNCKEGDRNGEVVIINVLGQIMVRQVKFPEDGRINCRNLPNGTYIIKKINAYQEDSWTFVIT